MLDEERDAYIVKKIVVDKHPTLIGGALPGGFYLAPGYFYISSVFNFIFNMNPIAMGYVAATVGTLSALLIFYAAYKMFGPAVAVISMFFYTFSYLVVIYNRTWWPLTPSIPVSIACYLSLYKIVKTKNLNWVFLLVLSLIIGVQSDPSTLSLLVLVPIIFAIYKISIKSKKVLAGVALLLISHLPLLLFDIRHNFLNSRAILNFFMGSHEGNFSLNFSSIFETLLLLPRNLSRFFWVFGEKDVAIQIAPASYYTKIKFDAIPTLIIILSSLILIFFGLQVIRKGKKEIGALIVGLHITIATLGVIVHNLFFGNWNFEWILQVLFPAYALVAGILVAKLTSKNYLKIPVFLFLVLFAFFSSKVIIESGNSYNLGDKLDAVRYASSIVENKDFSLDSIGENFAWGGYRYLFYYEGSEPVKSYMDPAYTDWLYPKEIIAKEHPETIVVMVNPDFYQDTKFYSKYLQYLTHTQQREQFGKIEVLIVDNSEKWVK